MKTVWTGRVAQTAAKYGEHAPLAAVCCNACRMCTTTNVLTLAAGVGLGALYAVGRGVRRLAGG